MCGTCSAYLALYDFIMVKSNILIMDLVLYPYKSSGKIVILYILIFSIVESKQSDNLKSHTGWVFTQNNSKHFQNLFS
jgi:hypothetical protein